MSLVWRKIQEIDLNPETAFRRRRPPPAPRRVVVNADLPPDAVDSKGRVIRSWIYCTNQVKSSKYTLYNFVFKNLLEQFRRVANIFFLVLVILQFFPEFSTISPGVAMLPLLIVLAITMIKDGYEDVKRHQSDRSINLHKTHILAGGGFKNHNATEAKSRSLSFFLGVLRQYVSPVFGVKHKPSPDAAPAAEELPIDSHGHAQSMDISRTLSPTPMSPIDERNTVNFTSPLTSPVSASHEWRSPQQRRSMHSERSRRTSGTHTRKRDSMLSELHHKHDDTLPYWRTRTWEDLKVGDIVKLQNNEEVPADILICSTSEDDGICFVETKNLDGEINLKSRYAVPELSGMRTKEDCMYYHFDVEVESQNTDMYRFNARVNMHDEVNEQGLPLQYPVTLSQVALRGCTLRNTDWTIGVVVMTGLDSKVVLNSGDTPSKRSLMELQMNRMVYVNLAIIAVIAVVCAIADAQLEKHYFNLGAYWEYAATRNDDNPNINGLIAFANSLITFQNFVPISLYISFEVVRTIQALFIFEDHDMYYEKAKRRTTAKSWNLSDELGQIQYIISDKTGTLTQNLMIFRECSVGGTIYKGENAAEAVELLASRQRSEKKVHPDKIHVCPAYEDMPPYQNKRLSEIIDNQSSSDHTIVDAFFHCLSLCHTVHVAQTEEKDQIMYKAESPDEQALVQTAADNGYVFCGRRVNTVQLQVPHTAQREKYEILHVLEFSSARKRMSVVARREADNKLLLFVKGADSMIYSRLADGQRAIRQETDKTLEEFANNGLRTLCFAMAELDVQRYAAWENRYHEASIATEEREERMEELASELERNLYLLGATAIEDRLQDGVPETIADLKRAGINVWVATGDKLETAIAIGYSTMLLAQDMNLIVVRGGEFGTRNSAYQQLERAVERFFGGEEVVESMQHQPPPTGDAQSIVSQRSMASQASLVGGNNGARSGGYALVIDGHALGFVLEEPYSRDLLLRVAVHCRAVVCCRVSPLQKALIVRLIRDGMNGITLAIGDGANDVSMIQAAHVGVGVAGEEGLQAVNSSDYAIGQFRFLKRLVLVHGHWSYYRNSKMINLFFYKQVVHTGTLFWFQIYCAWSTTQAMDYVYLLLYNAIWTVAPVVGIGIFDCNMSDHALMQIPELYAAARERSYFGMMRFFWYMVDGLYQSVVLFFFFMYVYDTTSPRNDGFSIDMYEPTTGMVIATVFAANLYCGLDALAWNWWIVFSIFVGPILIFVFAPIYAAFPPTLIWTYSWGNNYALYRSAQFWFMNILTVVLCLLPRFLYEYWRIMTMPNDVDVVRIIDTREPRHDYVHDPRMPGMRAAQAYESEAMDGDISMRSIHNDDHPLMPVQSRHSSVQYDMSTGQEAIYRGYSFDATDGPIQRPRNRIRQFGSKLNPSHLLRRRTTRKKDEDGAHYISTSDRHAAVLSRGASVAHSDDYTSKRRSFMDDTTMDIGESSDPPLPHVSDAATPSIANASGVSDTFFSVLEGTPSMRNTSGTYMTPRTDMPRFPP
ncbi:P-type phospholipid transporter [Malassezia vespertilionis]|nr:P-type phospholipid transporter [Malassezia vespertilionis]WFD04967.1 P-type phospholipid transporter [Malassezia vespertilionis]